MSSQANEKSTKRVNDADAWEAARRRNGKRPPGFRDKATKQIERLLTKKAWSKARALLPEELIFAPMDHWLWMHLGLTYYEEGDYEKALWCSKRAVELEPSCPLALWHYAGALYMAGEHSSALAIWTLILNSDLEDIAYGDC